jgi:hypothetical protein
MRNQFIQLTSGWIPLSVLLLFAIALITGQARGNVPTEIQATPVPPVVTTSIDVVPDSDMLKKLETLPSVADKIMALPFDLEISIEAGVFDTPASDNQRHLRSRSN